MYKKKGNYEIGFYGNMIIIHETDNKVLEGYYYNYSTHKYEQMFEAKEECSLTGFLYRHYIKYLTRDKNGKLREI